MIYSCNPFGLCKKGCTVKNLRPWALLPPALSVCDEDGDVCVRDILASLGGSGDTYSIFIHVIGLYQRHQFGFDGII